MRSCVVARSEVGFARSWLALVGAVGLFATLLLVIPEAARATVVVAPSDDTTIRSDRPTTPAGGDAHLNVDASPTKHTLFKFTVSGVGGDTVSSARLRLYVNNSSPAGGDFFMVDDDSWSESTATWDTAPVATGSPIASLGSVTADQWYEVDVSSYVTGDGVYSFRVTTPSNNGAAYVSDEGRGGRRPQLVATLATSPAAVSFAAAGDHGANGKTAASLSVLDVSSVDFYVALGDLDYDQTPSDAAWCDYVKQRLPTQGSRFPFEILGGNHEDDDGPNGYVLNHAACLPDRLQATGKYGVEYFVDQPATNPLVRLIMISPGLRVDGVNYDYTASNSHAQWLIDRIDDARATGIPWVMVAMHKVCLTMAKKNCEVGADLTNLLVEKKVDLVLQGHDHNAQRTHQIGYGAGCTTVQPGAFDADCVANGGGDGEYPKGDGTVFVITGSFGRDHYACDATDSEAGYFAVCNDTAWGFMVYDVNATRIDGHFAASSGSYVDEFSIR